MVRIDEKVEAFLHAQLLSQQQHPGATGSEGLDFRCTVPYPKIRRYDDPGPASYFWNPELVLGLWCEVVVVNLDLIAQAS